MKAFLIILGMLFGLSIIQAVFLPVNLVLWLILVWALISSSEKSMLMAFFWTKLFFSFASPLYP
ncbi:hypothetical protein ACFL0Y_04805 [Patescibacteria group bacterium]